MHEKITFCGWEDGGNSATQSELKDSYRQEFRVEVQPTHNSSSHTTACIVENFMQRFFFSSLFQHGLAHLICSINLMYTLALRQKHHLRGVFICFLFFGREFVHMRRSDMRLGNIIKSDTIGETMEKAFFLSSDVWRRAVVQKEFERIRSLFRRVAVCASWAWKSNDVEVKWVEL